MPQHVDSGGLMIESLSLRLENNHRASIIIGGKTWQFLNCLQPTGPEWQIGYIEPRAVSVGQSYISYHYTSF